MENPLLEEREVAPTDLRWSAQLLASRAWKEFKLSGRDADIEIKAAGDPIAGFLTVQNLTGVVPPHAYKPSGVLQFIARDTVSTATIVYNTATYPYTNTAAFIAEAAAKPEIQPRWTSATARLENVAAW